MRNSSLLLLAALLFAGCGEPAIPNVSLAGTVTIDNVPLKEGFIVFYSTTPGGASVSAKVKDGRFEAPIVPQGQYMAAIRSASLDYPEDKPVDSSFAAPTGKIVPDPVPTKYREPSIPVDASQSNDALKIEIKR